MRITPEYAELNRQLHESHIGYGAGAYRWSEVVSNLRDELGAATVLDYGCGKGTLGTVLGHPDWLSEYDPAVEGKTEITAKQYDLVVCADVLEHVERPLIDEVLDHLWKLSKKGLFLVIATRPSSKTLADGRNAHLIQEDQAWWRQKLSQFFHLSSWSADGREIIAVAHRIHTIGDIKTVSAVSETIRLEQALLNIKKNKRRLDMYPAHSGTAVIACFGPSLRGAIPDIAAERASGATIVTVSGAHDFLIENGIVPDVHIDIDPREHKGYFTRNPNSKVRYWMASCCHPKVIDNLLPYDLTLFHIANSETDKELGKYEPDAFLLGGGGSVGTRAVNVMFTQGYRRFSIYGMDCSFAEDGGQHAAHHSGKLQQAWKCRCGEKWFLTSGTLVATAKSFIDNQAALEEACRARGEEPIDSSGDCIVTAIRGEGLLAEMIRVGTHVEFYRTPEMEPGEYDPYLKKEAEAA